MRSPYLTLANSPLKSPLLFFWLELDDFASVVFSELEDSAGAELDDFASAVFSELLLALLEELISSSSLLFFSSPPSSSFSRWKLQG